MRYCQSGQPDLQKSQYHHAWRASAPRMRHAIPPSHDTARHRQKQHVPLRQIRQHQGNFRFPTGVPVPDRRHEASLSAGCLAAQAKHRYLRGHQFCALIWWRNPVRYWQNRNASCPASAPYRYAPQHQRHAPWQQQIQSAGLHRSHCSPSLSKPASLCASHPARHQGSLRDDPDRSRRPGQPSQDPHRVPHAEPNHARWRW